MVRRAGKSPFARYDSSGLLCKAGPVRLPQTRTDQKSTGINYGRKATLPHDMKNQPVQAKGAKCPLRVPVASSQSMPKT